MDECISVVVPVYNTQDFLEECMESIVSQTYENLEIILVDDGSTDNSPRICDEWAERDGRIKVIHKENGGPSSARNAGIDSASGEYITFVDSDDYVGRDAYEKSLRLLEENHGDLVFFGVSRVNMDGKCIEEIALADRVMGKEEALTEMCKGNIREYAWNKVFKRELFDDIRFPLGHTFEDMAMMYKVFEKADVICSCPELLYYYRKRTSSIVAQMRTASLCDIFKFRYERYANLVESFPGAAEAGYHTLAISALALYDRTLWDKCPDRTEPERARAFLEENRDKILSRKIDRRFVLFYGNRGVYDTLRIAKHQAGNVVKYVGRHLKKK